MREQEACRSLPDSARFRRLEWRYFAPRAPRRRRGVVVRRDLVRGAEMNLGEPSQRVRPLLLDDLARRLLNRAGNAASQRQPESSFHCAPASR